MAELDAIYNTKLLELAAEAPCSERLAAPDATATAHSRLCGSTVTIDIMMSGDVVTAYGQTVKACLLGQATTAVVGRHILGATADELRTAAAQMRRMLKEEGPPPTGRFAELALLEPVRHYKARHGSVLLVFDAIEKAIAEIEQKRAGSAASAASGRLSEGATFMTVIRDPFKVEGRRGTIYPAAFAQGFEGRVKRALGNAGGLTQFGVNLTTLEPGAMSAHRHWHAREDEFVYVLDGELTLITDDGEETLRPGMAATFPAGEANGHHLINKSAGPATYLEIGTRSADEDAEYPDIDLRLEKRAGKATFFNKSGEPYP